MKLKKIALFGAALVCVVGLAACGGGDDEAEKDTTEKVGNEEKLDVKLSDIHSKVKEAYGDDYIPNMEYDDVFLTETLGLSKDDYDEIIAEGPLVSFHIDTFIAVKAKEGHGDTVEKKLSDYRDYLVNDAMMYPTNAIKIQTSQVVRHGNYVFFVCLGVIDTETEEEGDEAIYEKAEQNNKIAVDAIDSFFK